MVDRHCFDYRWEEPPRKCSSLTRRIVLMLSLINYIFSSPERLEAGRRYVSNDVQRTQSATMSNSLSFFSSTFNRAGRCFDDSLCLLSLLLVLPFVLAIHL